MRAFAGFVITLFLAASVSAEAVSFDFVHVGNAGNAADAETGLGAVPYDFAISKTEVTNAQYSSFLNHVDPTGTDPFGLYYPEMRRGFGGIEFREGNADGNKYVARFGREQNPVTYISFLDAMRFANWLHNGQGAGDTETGAYTVVDGFNEVRSPTAKYWIPSEDEWYKAAYHDASSGTNGVYFDYATRSNSEPVSDQPAEDRPEAVNYFNDDNLDNGFNDGFAISGVTLYPSPSVANPFSDVGAYVSSSSPYGTLDQNGNVYEWTEGLSHRRARGGSWFADSAGLRANHSLDVAPFVSDSFVLGFRVASIATSVPEPCGNVFWLVCVLGVFPTVCRVRNTACERCPA